MAEILPDDMWACAAHSLEYRYPESIMDEAETVLRGFDCGGWFDIDSYNTERTILRIVVASHGMSRYDRLHVVDEFEELWNSQCYDYTSTDGHWVPQPSIAYKSSEYLSRTSDFTPFHTPSEFESGAVGTFSPHCWPWSYQSCTIDNACSSSSAGTHCEGNLSRHVRAQYTAHCPDRASWMCCECAEYADSRGVLTAPSKDRLGGANTRDLLDHCNDTTQCTCYSHWICCNCRGHHATFDETTV
ncbi:hypothetical protein FB567DRAFT_95667 [Paraphoma chrysanthemicola]|uniref:Uncharacterized protein n=1 Tax=Paraphoma chrysanthemicola TaxID=798071 RepID=A0A8K0R4W4_9PLEO|nr:hypothetical protein FB567DRAFT_95667 [Paraphoma chrysanthemicola]